MTSARDARRSYQLLAALMLLVCCLILFDLVRDYQRLAHLRWLSVAELVGFAFCGLSFLRRASRFPAGGPSA